MNPHRLLHRTGRLFLIAAMIAAIGLGPVHTQESIRSDADWRNRVYAAMQMDDWNSALSILNERLRLAPEDFQLLYLRARILDRSGDYPGAINDLNPLIEKRPGEVNLYQLRADAKLKDGQFQGAIEDFDSVVRLLPDREPYLWQRGIAYYYAGRFEEGRGQFERHQRVNSNDVENAVWHFLCVTRSKGLTEARQHLIPIAGDPRRPMAEIHALFSGAGDLEAIRKASQSPELSESERSSASFYADLYLALYHEAIGDVVKAREAIERAAVHHSKHGYMGAIAKVHQRVMSGEVKAGPKDPRDQ